ncbi:hypothetical protein A3Q56_07809, partial [Intoshia linei]
FHLDHCGALPWFLQKTDFKGKCFMTHATKAIYRWLLADYVKVSKVAPEDRLYTEDDLIKSMEKIQTVNFHQEMFVDGVKFTCYHAGHVLGAAMFLIEIADVKILYTGDFSCEEDRHLMAAEVPNVRPNILITESTYGSQIHEAKDVRENRFRNLVKTIVTRGGRCLIPAFALGRAQELLLILDEFWQETPELQSVPIYYASSLAKKCMAVYKTYTSSMNDNIRKQIAINNPFNFKFVSNMKNLANFQDLGPCVVLASPGMLQSGLSRELFENWCTDNRNGVIVAGYCVKGTLAKEILQEPDVITAMNGTTLPLKCSVDYISFSAHTDSLQTSSFVRKLKPTHIILVHGEQNEMARLKASLLAEYENDHIYKCRVHNPMNTQAVVLEFTGDKILKVVGSLADTDIKQDKELSAILVKRNFKYHLMNKEDLHNFTNMNVGSINQKIKLEYTDTFESLKWHLSLLNCNMKVDDPHIYMFDETITITQFEKYILIKWIGCQTTDMLVDIIQSVLLRSYSSSDDENYTDTPQEKLTRKNFFDYAIDMFGDMFGIECIKPNHEDLIIHLNVDDISAEINIEKMNVECTDLILKKVLQSDIDNLKRAVTPIKI